MESLISSDPKVMLGKPVIKNTRITVEMILEKLGAKESFEQIVKEHPGLDEGKILAALDFAAKVLNTDTHYSTVA